MKNRSRWISALMLPLIASILFGCAAVQTAADDSAATGPEFSNTFTSSTEFVARAVVAGLTAVDPSAYKGWGGACPGCDVDAETFTAMCDEKNVQSVTLFNEYATSSNMLAYARIAWRDMKPGDLFILYISGHGGQKNDLDGDEDDGQDETICLWDGELSDDILRQLWLEVPDGVRVFMVTDTCHSGTNFKYRPKSFTRSVPAVFAGSLIHYGGCADGEYSYGTSSGGTFTTALVDGWSATNSYISWFAAAKMTMPKNQTPTYAEYGNVTDAFRNSVIFGPLLELVPVKGGSVSVRSVDPLTPEEKRAMSSFSPGDIGSTKDLK